MRNFLRFSLTLVFLLAGSAFSLQAQGFGPAIKVNDSVVTKYELAQRVRMLQLFRTPGDVRNMAADQLIDDRLRLQAARNLGISVGEEEILAGMEEFAGRANLTAEQFTTALGQAGVSAETFRDFVRAGVAWRTVVQARFGPRVQISEQEIDRAIEQSDSRGPADYSAIEYAAYYIPGGRTERALAQAAKVKTQVDTCDDLYGVAQGQPAEALERGTKAPGEIPADIAAELAKLDAGEVSTNLTRANGQTLVFLMLCGRSYDLSDAVPREGVALSIQNQRLTSYADGYLQQLRSEARITRY